MRKILILDDDQGNLDVLYLVCVDEGYNALKRDSAIDLVEIVTGFKPDLIFVDILLGKDNGIEVCRKLRNEISDSMPKIILMSACNTSLNKAKASGCADQFLLKPFDIDTIALMAADLTDRK